MKKLDKPRTDPIECKNQAPVGNKPKLLPITDMTKVDAGAGFTIGMASNIPEPQVKPKRPRP